MAAMLHHRSQKPFGGHTMPHFHHDVASCHIIMAAAAYVICSAEIAALQPNDLAATPS
jgi:hypothetical protein